MDATTQIVEFATSAQLKDVPAETMQRLSILLADNIVVAVIGARQPWFTIVKDAQRRSGSRGRALVLGSGDRFDAARAALCNGVAIGGFEFEHVHKGGHPSGSVFPAVLALAQDDPGQRSADDIVESLVVGYEVNIRIGNALTPEMERTRGFHCPAIGGTIGAAAACGRMLKLDPRQMAQALGVAASHACGLISFIQNGSMTKRLHLGRASQLGMESALLVAAGFTGPDSILSGPHNMLDAFTPTPSYENMLTGLGTKWCIDEIIIKQFNCHATAERPVLAARKFAGTHDVIADRITRIELRTGSDAAESRHLKLTGSTSLAVQYSVPLMVAVSLVADPRTTAEFWTLLDADNGIRELARRIVVVPDEERFGDLTIAGGAELQVVSSGRTHVVCGEGRSFPEDLKSMRSIVAGKRDDCVEGLDASAWETDLLQIAGGLLDGTIDLNRGVERLLNVSPISG